MMVCCATAVLLVCSGDQAPSNHSSSVGTVAETDTTYDARLARWVRDSVVIDSLGQAVPIDGLVAALLAWRANPEVPQLHEATFCEVMKLGLVHGVWPSGVAERRAFDRAGLSAEERARVLKIPALVPGDCDLRGLPKLSKQQHGSTRLDWMPPRPVPPDSHAGESAIVGDTSYETRLARWRRDSTVIDSIGSSIPVEPLVAAMLVWRREPGNPRLHEAVFCERFKLLRRYGAMPSARAEVRAQAMAGLSDDERERVRELPALVPGDCESGGTRVRARLHDSMRLDRLEPRPTP